MRARLMGSSLGWRVAAALIALYLVWGSTFLGIRIAVDTIPPLHMAAARWLLAGGLLYALARPPGGSSWRSWVRAAGLSLLLVVASNGGVTWAETRVASGFAALAIATVAPWLVVLDAARPGGRRPSPLTAAGVLLGVAGVASLVDPAAPVDAVAFGVLLVAAFAFALGTIVARTWPEDGSPIAATARHMFAGGAILGIGALLTESTPSFGAVSTSSWAAVAWLTLFGSIAGFTLYSWLLRAAPPALVGTYACVNPIVALALGAWLAGEEVTSRTLVAGALVVGSVALVTAGQALSSSPPVREVDWSPPVAYPDRT